MLRGNHFVNAESKPCRGAKSCPERDALERMHRNVDIESSEAGFALLRMKYFENDIQKVQEHRQRPRWVAIVEHQLVKLVRRFSAVVGPPPSKIQGLRTRSHSAVKR